MATATIIITLGLPDGADDVIDTIRDALDNLADVMLVQAEDGLYTLGSPDAEMQDVENEFICQFTSTDVEVSA